MSYSGSGLWAEAIATSICFCVYGGSKVLGTKTLRSYVLRALLDVNELRWRSLYDWTNCYTRIFNRSCDIPVL